MFYCIGNIDENQFIDIGYTLDKDKETGITMEKIFIVNYGLKISSISTFIDKGRAKFILDKIKQNKDNIIFQNTSLICINPTDDMKKELDIDKLEICKMEFNSI